MNKVREYLIRKKAKERAQDFAGEDAYIKNLAINDARVIHAGMVYDKVSKMRELISIPSVQNRDVKEQDAIKTLLVTGTLGAAGAVVASVIAGCDLGSASLITMAGSLSGMAIGEVGIQTYKANIGNKIATAIKRNKLRKEMSQAECDEQMAELYVRALEEEIEKV